MSPIRKSIWKVKGVPDYYEIYVKLWERYTRTGNPDTKRLAYHYARVAEEMGQAELDESDDETAEITL